ncbi:hypothetical protein FM107_02765 [Sphingobacterium sp. JB170]|nr:hypothetical protein FM107_02765 [Sphingobacterium sp. JB170]
MIAVFTNPSSQEHHDAVKAKVTELLKQQTGDADKDLVDFGMHLFGNTLVQQFIEQHVKVENYYLFSVTKISWQRKETVIGGGAFKTIFLSPKIDEKAAEIVQMIKEG